MSEDITEPRELDLAAQLAALRAENERLKREQSKATSTAKAVTFKVSEKGAVSVYGVGRFPVTLYATQWSRLLGACEELKGFIADAEAKGLLSHKEAGKPAASQGPSQAAKDRAQAQGYGHPSR